MDEEKAKHLPSGAVWRVMKMNITAKEKGMTKEIVPMMTTYLEKQIADLCSAGCDKAEADGKKHVTLKHLKDGAETRGILLE